MNVIEVCGLSKSFDTFTAVNGVTFEVRPGEVFGLLGPNGAGKTTLVRMLTTLERPTAGNARINGCDVASNPDGVRRSIGVIPQALTSDPILSVRENLAFFARLYSVPRARRNAMIGELLESVGLTKWQDATVRTLSGGMRRRAEIARGLIHEPKVFFLDEPTTGLDPASRASVWALLKRLVKERGLAVVITTHYMEEADALCDRLAVIDQGEIKALDTPARLKAAVAGHSTIEVKFSSSRQGWADELRELPTAGAVEVMGNLFRITVVDVPAATLSLARWAAASNAALESLSIHTAGLESVFMHYAKHSLDPRPAQR